MMRLLQWLILVPIAVIGIGFAVANRQPVDLSFDPFVAKPAAETVLQAPLFLVMLAAMAIGVILGGFFTWLAQGRYRRALRMAKTALTKSDMTKSDVMRR